MKNYRVVRQGLPVEEFGPECDFIAAMEVRGFEFVGVNESKHQRAELQGQPKFKGLLGPMFDGNAIRYECSETYAALSA